MNVEGRGHKSKHPSLVLGVGGENKLAASQVVSVRRGQKVVEPKLVSRAMVEFSTPSTGR